MSLSPRTSTVLSVPFLLTVLAYPCFAQELYRCGSYVEDWSQSQRILYVQGLQHGYGAAVAYAENKWNNQVGELEEEYRSYAQDSLVLESFVIGIGALRESIRDFIEPVLERPSSELRERMMILCRRSENQDEYVADIMRKALQAMKR